MAYRIEHNFTAADPFTLLGGESVVEEHLRLDIPAAPSDERTHLLAMAEAAVRHVAELTGRSPVAGTATVHTSTVPVRLELPFRVATLDKIEYLKDGETTYTELSGSNFGVFGDHLPAVLFSRNAFTDPGDTELDHPFPFRFTFTTKADTELQTAAVAAVEDDPNTPEDETVAAVAEVRQTRRTWQMAALLYLTHLYENRQAVTHGAARPSEVPLAFTHLIRSLRVQP